MFRKIIVNTLTAFILLPILSLQRYWGNILSGNYRIEDAYFETLFAYLRALFQGLWILSPLFLFFILLPFQLIKDFFHRKNIGLSIPVKCLVFSLPFAICYFVSFRGYMGYIMRYDIAAFLGPLIVCGILFPVVLYFLVDRYTEKKEVEDEQAS